MSLARRGLELCFAGATLISGVSAAERIIDPFDNHARDYVVEGPKQRSEVFYVSVNYYDTDGEKHDDRTGDLLLFMTCASALGFVSLRVSEPRAEILAENSVTSSQQYQ